MAAACLLAVGYAGVVAAHTQSGALGTASSGAAAVDQYFVSCYNDGNGAPARLSLRVRDLAPVKPAQVSARSYTYPQITPSANSLDTVDGDANYSPLVYSYGTTTQNYYVNVNKSASSAGQETYVAEFHCQTAGGVHTGTSWTMTVNQ